MRSLTCDPERDRFGSTGTSRFGMGSESATGATSATVDSAGSLEDMGEET
jgi:hypothetical protein